MKESAKNFLFKPLNSYRLSLFRIVFGIFATLESLYLYKVHFIEDYVIGPLFLFNYDFLPVEPLSEGMMQVLLFLCLVSSVLILLGKFYKIAISSFFVIFSYFFLLDKSIYNNHLYLIALLGFLLIFIPADETLSLKKKKGKEESKARNWHLLILQFQFVVVYFFGGVAKINYDWLVLNQPAKQLLKAVDVSSELLLNTVVYGGMLFDLLIGFLLLWKPTRIIAAVGVLVFNIGNHLLFDDINIFPFFMMASLVVFIDITEWKSFSKWKTVQRTESYAVNKKILWGLGIYVVIQLFLPLRHFLITSDPDWTGQGQYFAWRMKIQTRQVEQLEYAIFDLNKKTIYPVTIKSHIHDYQIKQLANDPRMMIDFAHYLGDFATKKSGLRNVMVKAKVKIKFNGREGQYVFSPETNLLREKYKHFSENKWINDLKTP